MCYHHSGPSKRDSEDGNGNQQVEGVAKKARPAETVYTFEIV
jgi:hypothetical protein